MASAVFSPVVVTIGPVRSWKPHLSHCSERPGNVDKLLTGFEPRVRGNDFPTSIQGSGEMFPPLHMYSKASQDTYGTVRAGERETRDRENCGDRLGQTHHS